jgi:hypothetical protein
MVNILAVKNDPRISGRISQRYLRSEVKEMPESHIIDCHSKKRGRPHDHPYIHVGVKGKSSTMFEG